MDNNRVAHELAHCSPWVIGIKVWLANFPSCINYLLASDISMDVI